MQLGSHNIMWQLRCDFKCQHLIQDNKINVTVCYKTDVMWVLSSRKWGKFVDYNIDEPKKEEQWLLERSSQIDDQTSEWLMNMLI